jgi:hypothetical protein
MDQFIVLIEHSAWYEHELTNAKFQVTSSKLMFWDHIVVCVSTASQIISTTGIALQSDFPYILLSYDIRH